MFSLQTIFGKGDKFYGLLESSAGAARRSAAALTEFLAQGGGEAKSLDEFRLARQREKKLAAEISEALVNTFVTALEREDIEACPARSTRFRKSSRNSPSGIRWSATVLATSISSRAHACSRKPATCWRRW